MKKIKNQEEVTQAEVLDCRDIVLIKMSDITLGQRKRKYYNGIESLAEAIAAVGLDHPITVMPHPERPGKYILVAGGRRYKAFEFLKRDEIPAVVKQVKNPLVSEAVENDQRESFVVEEMLDMAEAIIDTMAERRGAPKKGAEAEDDENDGEEENLDSQSHLWPGLKKGETTRDYAARIAGFKSTREFRRAREVKADAHDDVWKALNTRVITLNCAHEISQQPADIQISWLNAAKDDPDTDRKGIRRLNELRREKKRLESAGIDPEKTNDPDVLPALIDCFSVVYASPDFFGSKVRTLSKFPIHSHILNESLVFIEALSVHNHTACELAIAWGLFPKDVVAFRSTNGGKNPLGGYVKEVSKVVIICGFDEEKSTAFKKVKVPLFHECDDLDTGPRDFVMKYFGKAADGKMLDVSFRSGQMRPRWTCCWDRYGYAVE